MLKVNNKKKIQYEAKDTYSWMVQRGNRDSVADDHTKTTMWRFLIGDGKRSDTGNLLQKVKMKGRSNIYMEEMTWKMKGHFGLSNQPLKMWQMPLLH